MGNIQRGVMSVLMMLALFSLCYLQQQLAGFWLAAGIAITVLAIAVAIAVAIFLATSIAIVLAASNVIADDIGDKSISCRAVRPSDAFMSSFSCLLSSL